MSSTPAATEHQQPSAVATYILPAVHTKRVRLLAADGAEEEADDNPWVHMQLKDPFQQTQPEDAEPADAAAAAADGDAAAEADAEQPKPEEVIKSFAAAKGELEWLMAMLSTLQEGKYLTVGKSERAKDSGQQLLADMAIQTNARFRRRAAAAEAASDSLLAGANALRALGQKEDAFYSQVAQLQRYWKVRQEPPDSPYAYSVNLSLSPPDSSSSSSRSSSAAAGPDAAAMVGRGPVDVVYILKDPAGNLRVQVPAPKTPGPPTVTYKGLEAPPEVYTGPAAIHALLLRQLRLNAWHMVVASLDDEVSSLLQLPAHLRQLLSAAQPSQQQGLATASGSNQQQQQQQQQVKFADTNGHLTLFASLSSLVLQAVAGAAGTAGEAAALQQQQQQQQQQGDVMAVDSPGPGMNGFSLYDLTDVGQPWQKAAAEAAARLGQAGANSPWGPGSRQQQQGGGGSSGSSGGGCGSSGGSSLVPRVVIDPQLLSMRPLALEHLLITQLGHLVSSLRHTSESAYMAPIAYAAAARQVHDRARQRLLQHQQQQQQLGGSRGEDAAGGASAAAAAAAAGQLAPKPGSLKFGRPISFLHCFGLWLQHLAQRDVLRGHVDRALQEHPGVVARCLQSTHFCVSAMQLRRSQLDAAAVGVGGVQQQRRRQQQQVQTSAAAAALLLLLSGSQLTLEAPGLSVPPLAAAGRTSAGGGQAVPSQWLEPAAQSSLSVSLQGLERMLQQLLQQW